MSGNACPFTGISWISLEEGGGVVIRNCLVTSTDDIDDDTGPRTLEVVANPANTVSTGRRFDADGDGVVGPQDYRASLDCPLRDAFTVTIAPK